MWHNIQRFFGASFPFSGHFTSERWKWPCEFILQCAEVLPGSHKHTVRIYVPFSEAVLWTTSWDKYCEWCVKFPLKPAAFVSGTGITGKETWGRGTCLSWSYCGHWLLGKAFLAKAIFSLIGIATTALHHPAGSPSFKLVQRYLQTFQIYIHQLTCHCQQLPRESACSWCFY